MCPSGWVCRTQLAPNRRHLAIIRSLARWFAPTTRRTQIAQRWASWKIINKMRQTQQSDTWAGWDRACMCASPAAEATRAASDLSEPQSLVLGGVYVCITSAKRVMYPALIINVMTWISENVIIAASPPASQSASGRPPARSLLSLSLWWCRRRRVSSHTWKAEPPSSSSAANLIHHQKLLFRPHTRTRRWLGQN